MVSVQTVEFGRRLKGRRSRLYLRDSTIDEQLGSCDVAAVIGGEEHDRSRDLIWRTEWSERNVLAIIARRCSPTDDDARRSQNPGVSVDPGLTAFTRMRRDLRSVAQVRTNDRTAAFVALYTLLAASPVLAAIEVLSTIDAPSTSRGNAFCTVNKTPFTLLSKWASKSSSVISPRIPNLAMPPFAMTTSNRCFSSLILANRLSSAPSSATSP